jgi:uncharacterized membrane protein
MRLCTEFMPDPADPLEPQPAPSSADVPPPPPPPPPVLEREVNASTLDLPSNVAAALACVPLVGGIIFYILEKRDGFVRFYAMQSIIFGGAWFLVSIVVTIIHMIFASVPAIGVVLSILWGLVGMIVHLAFVVIWIIATVKAFTGVRWEIPYIGPVARKQVEGTATLGRT